jgi:hypothetical protein
LRNGIEGVSILEKSDSVQKIFEALDELIREKFADVSVHIIAGGMIAMAAHCLALDAVQAKEAADQFADVLKRQVERNLRTNDAYLN